MKRLFIVMLTFWVIGSIVVPLNAVQLVDPPNFIVAGVIGASFENGQASDPHPVSPNVWYFGGAYKTWVDYIACIQEKDYHWLNYARAGEISINGINQLNDMLMHTMWPDEQGIPYSRLEVLVIGNWGNDYLWLPNYDQAVMDALITNVYNQIALAKSFGVKKIIITGWPNWEDIDLDYFITLFPMLTTHLDESQYNQAKEYYYNAFSNPNPDFLFAETTCLYTTFDGIHPSSFSSKKAAQIISHAVKHYEKLVGKKSLFCH